MQCQRCMYTRGADALCGHCGCCFDHHCCQCDDVCPQCGEFIDGSCQCAADAEMDANKSDGVFEAEDER